MPKGMPMKPKEMPVSMPKHKNMPHGSNRSKKVKGSGY